MYTYPRIGAVVDSLGGERVLRASVESVSQLAKCVRDGLPVRSLYSLTHRFPETSRRRIEQLVAARSTLQRRGASGTLSAEESERLERLARVSTLAEYVWETREAAQAWLTNPLGLLGDEAPLDYAASELGARRVEEILWALEYSLPV